jgi:hypothetical protein
VYPVSGLDRPDGENYLWYVGKGVERLVKWTGGRKPVWNCIETARIGNEKKATPEQVRSEVWMSLIHGSRGLIYFVHEFVPKFNEHALLDDPAMLKGVTRINREIRDLSPVLNSPTIRNGFGVKSGNPSVPVRGMMKRHGGSTYLFTVGMRNDSTDATFALNGSTRSARVEVLGEGRTISMINGEIHDAFKPYDVHLYRLRR